MTTEQIFLLGIVIIGSLALFYWNFETEYEKERKKSMVFEMYIVYINGATAYTYNEHAKPLLEQYQKNIPKIKYVTLKYIDKKNINILQ